MRSKLDTKIDRGARRRKVTPFPGGKALQRLFTYLGQRDPALNNEIVASIAVDPQDPKQLLVVGAVGGIWESSDTGTTWQARTDFMPSLAIGAVTFDPNAPKRVYAGSGEGNFYANLGAGVYRSSDGGTTWGLVASAPFIGVGFYDLVVDPQNPKVLYAATTNGFYR